MSTATKPIGLKRICTGCGAKFYDLNKRPIICPSCEVEFTGEIKVKRRGRAAAEVKKDDPIKAEIANKNEDEIIEEEDDGVEVVSLDDAEKPEVVEEEGKTIIDDEDTLEDIPDLGEDIIVDDLAGDEDEILVDDEDQI